MPARPGFDIPRLPVKLSEYQDDRLMQLFVALTRWTDHLAGKVAEAEVDERAADAALSRAQSQVLLAGWAGGKDDRVTLAKAERDLDPEVERRRDELDRRHAYRKMLGVLFSSTERDAAVVSREISRRIGRREDNDRRASRWTP